MKCHVRVNPKNGMFLKHFCHALNIFNTFWEVGSLLLLNSQQSVNVIAIFSFLGLVCTSNQLEQTLLATIDKA